MGSRQIEERSWRFRKDPSKGHAHINVYNLYDLDQCGDGLGFVVVDCSF